MEKNRKPKPSLALRLRVLSAIDYAPGDNLHQRIKSVSQRTFVDEPCGQSYQFTWRTIETWCYRFKKHGITTLDKQPRRDKNTYRKVKLNELAEAIKEVLPTLRFNKTGSIPKIMLYRKLLENNYFARAQFSQTAFYRMLRENDLLNTQQTRKLRQSFAMQYANELWQDRYDVHGCTNAAGAWMRRSGRCMGR